MTEQVIKILEQQARIEKDILESLESLIKILKHSQADKQLRIQNLKAGISRVE